ncbi:MAG TPA: putative protein N(5)-glutamine methyltransferase [Jatrophihabitans sp.]|nr:putative protein N(5)-glutamine methyltransferase [Jatrophihabitans sp.]
MHLPAAGEQALVARLRAAGCVFAEDEAGVLLASAGSDAELAAMTAAREAGVPLEHVVGWAEFCGLRVSVEPGVFVPRRRSELLVREALRGSARRVLDLCCGCGAIGLAIVTGSAGELHAVDLDPAAVGCAARNLAAVGGTTYTGDLYAPLPAALRGQFDVVVANAPYVPSDAIVFMPPEARLHEARVALDGGADGLAVQRRVIAAAPGWLRPGGRLLVETSSEQAPLTGRAMREAGLAVEIVADEQLAATAAVGVRAA